MVNAWKILQEYANLGFPKTAQDDQFQEWLLDSPERLLETFRNEYKNGEPIAFLHWIDCSEV